MVTRADILRYADENHNAKSERLWEKSPDHEVLRHSRNRKHTMEKSSAPALGAYHAGMAGIFLQKIGGLKNV